MGRDDRHTNCSWGRGSEQAGKTLVANDDLVVCHDCWE